METANNLIIIIIMIIIIFIPAFITAQASRPQIVFILIYELSVAAAAACLSHLTI